MKIKAFTVIELLVAMMISSILIGLSWFLITMSNSYRERVEYKAENLNHVKRIQYLLSKGMAQAGRYQLENDLLDLWFENDSVSYLMNTNEFIRVYHGINDTIAVGLKVNLSVNSDESISASISFGQQRFNYIMDWVASSKQKVRLNIADESEGTFTE